MWCGSEGKEDPREVGNPIWGGTAGSEGIFETAVVPFNHSVGLWVEGSGGEVGNLQEGRKLAPEGGGELGTSVRGEGVGDSKAGNPRGTQSISTGGRGRGGKRNSL